MRFNIITRYIGLVLVINALFMLLSAFIAVYYGIDTGLYPLIMSAILTVALGCFPLIFVDADNNINSKEAYIIVVGSWVISCVVGTFPYLLWGGEFTVVNAWFESVSGFTTTGSTILNDIEAVPKSLLFWRSSTHWLGGIGVMMFVLVAIPSLGRVKMTLSNIQMSALAKDNFKYKTQKIVKILLFVYIGLTFTASIFLRIAGMDWFDSINHAFSTVATGGFSTRSLSISYFSNKWVEIIITLFTVIAGIHFGVLYATLTGKKNNIFRSEVTMFYIWSLIIGGVLITGSLWFSDTYNSLGEAARYAYFQAATICTTTGFATTDTNIWPPFALVILIYFSFTSACSGSTTGGLKADRILLSYKSVIARVKQLQHPNAIIRVKMDKTIIEDNTLSLVNMFIVIYILFVLLGTLLISISGLDLMTSFSAAFASMGNVGPGFGAVSSLSNYSVIPDYVKIICTLLMLIGRLEIFGLLLIAMIRIWR
ncbi:MAG: TrkH family potassium uptake protein [Rikenellaceae bacterium]|nr:TrkH family potassium uptake protein [Rikenellaceae bacterium]